MSRASTLVKLPIGLSGDASGNVTASGNLTLSGTGKRITGDFSNATVSNRTIFQTSTTNGQSRLVVIPNGTADASAIDLFVNAADIPNSPRFSIRTSSADMAILAAREGTGSYLPITFFTGGSERMRIDTSGNTTLAGNLVLASGKGIDFSANANAGGMTGEVLDDYETGSWTPDWRIGSNAAGTWVIKTGRYTKIGNMVTVWAYLYSSTGRGSGTGSVTINNLPFNSVNSTLTNYHIMDARGGVSWSSGGAGLPYFYHPASTSYIIAYYTSNGTGAVTVQMTEANFSASSAIEINIMMTYETN